MGRTKKVGMTGKFGTRYGIKIKRDILKVVEKKTKECPYCGKNQLKRASAGIWECQKCKVRFAGGAYTPVQSASEGGK